MSLMICFCRAIKNIISRRTWNPRICRPSNISSASFQHMFGDRVSCLCSKSYFDLHFKEINKTSNHKRNGDISPVCCLQVHDVNHHSKHTQYTSVVPKKAQRLNGVIKNFLPFLYRLNLHVLLIDILHVFIIPIQFLKIYVFKREKRDFCVYSEENSLYLLGK